MFIMMTRKAVSVILGVLIIIAGGCYNCLKKSEQHKMNEGLFWHVFTKKDRYPFR